MSPPRDVYVDLYVDLYVGFYVDLYVDLRARAVAFGSGRRARSGTSFTDPRP